MCPTCGKRFARPDVLRRHIAGSCKSRQAGAGAGSRERSGNPVDATVHRKRRRQRAHPSASSSVDVAGPILAGPGAGHQAASEEMVDDPRMDIAPPSSRHDHRLSRSSLDGEGQRGTPAFNMSMPPPLMVTPESLGTVDLPRLPPQEQAAAHQALGEGSWGNRRPSDAPLVQPGRMLTTFDPLIAVHRPSLDYLSNSESGHSVDAGAGGLMVPTPPMPEMPIGFNDPTNANNMDHLFNWLFSMTNIENVSNVSTRGHKTPVVGPTGFEATQPDMAQPWMSHADQVKGHLVPRLSRSPVLEPLSESTSHEDRSYPTRIPHEGGPPFPAFPETWDESGWRLPPPKELIDEQARSDMRDLFDGPERDYFSTPAFSIAEMKLYLELYFL